jgi:hypothetical protein
MASVWVTMPTAVAWPAPAKLAARNVVTDAHTAAGIGSYTRVGSGEKDFSFRVADARAARTAFDAAMQAHMSGVA